MPPHHSEAFSYFSAHSKMGYSLTRKHAIASEHKLHGWSNSDYLFNPVSPDLHVLAHSACLLSGFSCVRLRATPWTTAQQAPLAMRFSRWEYWSGLPCPPPGDRPNPGMEPTSLMSPALTVFTNSATWDALRNLWQWILLINTGEVLNTVLGTDWHQILCKFLNLIYRVSVSQETKTNINNGTKDLVNLLEHK